MSRVVFLVLAALLTFTGMAGADCFIKMKTETSGFAGLGGTKGKTETYISGNKQVEITEMDIKSPLLKPFMSGSKTRTITDLDSGKIISVNEEDKTYTEMSFEDMKKQVEAARARFEGGYEEAKEGVEKPMPQVEGGEVKMEMKMPGEKKKFAGVEAERTVLVMRSTSKDVETGEEVTYKITYDTWLAPDFPAAAEQKAFAKAYAERFQEAWVDNAADGEFGFATALAATGLGMDALTPHMKGLQGFPAKMTVRIGPQLSPEQRAELAKQMAEQEKEKDSGGGGLPSLGGLKKQLTDEATGALTDAFVESMFGEGVTMDEDGDPVFFSFTSELDKVELKPVKADKFEVGEKYKKAGP